MLGLVPKLFVILVLTLSAVGAGCFPDTSGTTPPVVSTYFYYPIGLGLTRPDGRYLLAANSNFDLLYNSGSVVPFNLEPVYEVIESCRGGQGCAEFIVSREADAIDSRYQVVDFVLEDHSILIGSYASSLAVTDDLALIPVRADASLHFIDVFEVDSSELNSSRVLRCRWGEGSLAPTGAQTCSSHRRVNSGRRLRDDQPIGVPSEPFGIQPWQDPDDGTEYVIVGHMVGGEVSLFEKVEAPLTLPRECGDNRDNDGDGALDSDDPGCMGPALQLIDVEDSFSEGTTGLAVDDEGRFLATSRFNSVLTAFRINNGQIAPIKTITIDAISPGENQRGIIVSPERDRAYVVSREPASVLVLDLTHDDSGDYRDQFVAVVEIGSGPSIIRVHEDDRYDLGYLVYAVCFDEDRIFVIDPAINEVIDVITTRRGPHDLVFDASAGVGYLANFLESTVSVLDVDPDSAQYHSILTTLGRPRRPRSND